MPFTLSPSSLSLFKDCPRCFWLQEVKQQKRPASKYPSLPWGIDLALKKRFDYFREKEKLPPELQKLGDVKLFDSPFLALWKNGRMGLRWKDEQGNMLRGAVDDILEQDGKLMVLEYATRGFPLKKDTPWLYQDQLNLYTYLLQKSGHPVASHAYLLFYYPKEVSWQGDIWFHKRLYQMRVSLRDAERLWQDALHVLHGEMPAPSGKCGFCGWRKEI